MMQPIQTCLRIVLVVMLASPVAAGCGRKGPPLPPLKQTPAQAETEKQEEHIPPPSGPARDEMEGKEPLAPVPPYP